MVADLRYFNSLELEVDSLRSQLETQKTQFLNEIDRLSREYYYADHMNAILSVYTKLDEDTNLQCDYLELLEKCECLEKELSKSKMIPQLKSNPIGDRIMRNNIQGKKQEVEDRRRNVKFSKNKTFVTACNDNLNAKTLNVNFVCATYEKCVLNDKHDMCVLNSVENPLKKTVDSESNQKPRNITRKLYERISKTCSWWYTKFTPSGYKWKPKFDKENVNSNTSMPLGSVYRTANILEHVTYRHSTVSNTPLSSNSFAARRDCPIHRRLWVVKNDIVVGLPKLKFAKDHLCSYCELWKAKQNYFHTKLTPSSKRRLQLLHMDLCGPMRVASINGKRYVLVIVDDYSRYTWTHFLRHRIFESDSSCVLFVEGILHQTSVARTPKQNGVVERRNRTLVEAARTMLSAAKVHLFFWAEAIATTCFTQNRSLVIPRHEKTPYHIINDWKPSVKFFHIFGSLCYIVRDGENLDKMKEKGDAYHVSFDPTPECQSMALEHDSLSPTIQRQEKVPQEDMTVTTSNELDLLFSLMFDELLNGSSKVRSKSSTISTADAPNQRLQHTTPLNNHTTPAPTCSHGIDLYSITLQDTNCPNLICLMAKETSSQAWLWHRHLSRLNFDTINYYGWSSKVEIRQRLSLFFLYTWTHFLRSEDETPEVLIDFLRLVQRGLQAQVRIVRTDKGSKFVNQTLHAYFVAEGITHQASVARTPEQNGVVERRNRTLVVAARTMLSATKVPLFLWDEAIATACFTQNHSLVIP
nr:hypothetical protein [Tanacetum cinerariifolium]